MSQNIDSDFQNSLKEDENLFGFHDNSDICLSNDNIWSSLDFNSPNNDPINLVNIFTQPTSSFSPNNNICIPFQNNENKDNNQKEQKKEKDRKEQKKEKKEKKKLGRKKKNSTIKSLHTKYSSDNIIRKIKTHIIKWLFNKINIEINKAYNGKFSKSIYKKQLLKINQKNILESGNKKFLNQTLQEIFSNEISCKYKKHLDKASYNQQIILKLLNEKDEKKRKKFEDLFKLTFLDCLKHFRESENYKELEGLTTLKNVISNFEEDPEYANLFEHYVQIFEKEIERIKEK